MDTMNFITRILTWINFFLILGNVNLFAEEPDEYISDLTGGFSEGEYRIIRYFEDNPIDPNEAEIEYLLDIPGFPGTLAERVIAAVKKSGGSSEWILLLSPDDRKRIYNYKRFLILPFARNYDLSLRYTRRCLTVLPYCRDDGYIRIENGLSSFRVKIRSSCDITEVTAYSLFNLLNKQLRVHTGDFLPDFAMGLVASGHSFYYPFSYGYPLNKYKWVSMGTYFYGRVIRGVAADYKKGFLRALIYNGVIREHDDARFNFGGDPFRGGRMEVRIGESRFGVSVVEEGSAVSARHTGLDARCEKENLNLAFELALSPSGGRAFSCGGKIKNAKMKTGFLVYKVDHSFSNSMGKIPSDGRKVNGEQGGMSAVVERGLARRLYLRCSIERWVNRRSYSLSEKLSLSLQLIKKLKRKKLCLEWKYGEYKREILVPRGIEYISGSNALKFLFTCKGGEYFSFRNSIRVPWSEDYFGYLIAPSLKFLFPNGHFKGDFSLAFYKALEGTPFYYYYQPSVEGGFAWKYLSGSGFRSTLGFEISCKRILFHMLFSTDSSGQMDIIIQVIMKL
ncbi:hypothetical protein J7M07_06225 [bacterium]|nr:hypothetical protein [bacterium]